MNSYSYLISVNKRSGTVFFILFLFFYSHITRAAPLMDCKYLVESSPFSAQLSTDDFVNHIRDLKRCNRNLRVYEPSEAKQPLYLSTLSSFQNLLPEKAPANIHELIRLLSAYLVTWEKDLSVESLSARDSDHRFLLLNSPRKSVVDFCKEAPAVQEGKRNEPTPGATASRSSASRKVAILLYSLMDSDYPFGFVIRSDNGDKTYLICRYSTFLPTPSVTQLSTVSTSPPAVASTPHPMQTPSDIMIDFLTRQLDAMQVHSNCHLKN